MSLINDETAADRRHAKSELSQEWMLAKPQGHRSEAELPYCSVGARCILVTAQNSWTLKDCPCSTADNDRKTRLLCSYEGLAVLIPSPS